MQFTFYSERMPSSEDLFKGFIPPAQEVNRARTCNFFIMQNEILKPFNKSETWEIAFARDVGYDFRL